MSTRDVMFHCNATALDVRRVLGDLRAHLRTSGILEDDCSNIELALAEALNNIVEHAFAYARPGTITLILAVGARQITCELRDQGAAMPDLQPQSATAPDIGEVRATWPEGGFGWSIIRALTVRLHYLRDGAENRLILDFDLGRS